MEVKTKPKGKESPKMEAENKTKERNHQSLLPRLFSKQIKKVHSIWGHSSKETLPTSFLQSRPKLKV